MIFEVCIWIGSKMHSRNYHRHRLGEISYSQPIQLIFSRKINIQANQKPLLFIRSSKKKFFFRLKLSVLYNIIKTVRFCAIFIIFVITYCHLNDKDLKCHFHRDSRTYQKITRTVDFHKLSMRRIFSSMIIRHTRKTVVITWYQIRTINVMHLPPSPII